MKYIFYLLCSKLGIVFSGSGRCRLNSALSAFTTAQKELKTAIDHELQTIKSKDKALEKARKEFRIKEKLLTEQTQVHMKTRKESLVYLNKIDAFLNVDTPETDGDGDLPDDAAQEVDAVNNSADVKAGE